MSYWILPHVGHATKSGTSSIKRKLRSNAFPMINSSFGGPDTEIRIVSPIPSCKSTPNAAEDFTAESAKPPASVTPK